MKRSVLKLLSSVYILLVSVILIVISAYAWMVISDSPMAGNIDMGVAGRDEIGLPDKDYSIWDGHSTVPVAGIKKDGNGIYVITNAEEFVSIMRYLETAPAGEDITMRLEADISLAELPWRPVRVSEAFNANTITILGNDKELVCMISPLFESGAAGESAIIINDLTISKSNISNVYADSVGAFIEDVDGIKTVEFNNCHVTYSTVTGSDYTGAFIGSTAGRTGSVDTTVTLTNCTVEHSEITGVNTVGGFIGKAGADPATLQTLTNCVVSDSTLTSTNKTVNGGVGTMVGLANLGDIYIVDCSTKDIYEDAHEDDVWGPVYGLEDYGTTGSLTIINNGVEVEFRGNRNDSISVKTVDDLLEAMKLVADPTHQGDITINIENNIDLTGVDWTPVRMATENSTATITINGNGNSLIGLRAPLLEGGIIGQKGQEHLVINDLTIDRSTIVSSNSAGSGALIECVAGLESVTLSNCCLMDSNVSGTFNDGARTGGLIGYTSTAADAQGNVIPTTVTVTNCSVVNSNITSHGTVGGILGHASENSAVTNIIEGCSVIQTTLTTTQAGNKGVGTIVGTVDRGLTEITNCTFTNVTEVAVSGESNTEDVPFGRISLDDTAKLVITEGEDKYEYVKGTLTVTAGTAGAMFKGFGIYSDGFDGTVNIEQGGDIDLSGGLGGFGGLFTVTPSETTASTETTAPAETPPPVETTAPVTEPVVPIETTVPVETTAPVTEPAAPAETTSPAEPTVTP